MPIITFLRDIVATVKGPYYRKVGKYTERFCSRGAKKAVNPVQRKLFLVSAICADEVVAGIMGLDHRRKMDSFKERSLQKTSKGKVVAHALRVYLSALLVLTSQHKELLLIQTAMKEDEILTVWQWVFEYLPPDMQIFNEFLGPAYQQQGLVGLVTATGNLLLQDLFLPGDELWNAELEDLRNNLVDDAAVILGVLQAK